MHLTENQIALDAMECVLRPGVQMLDHPFIVTISPERMASSIELAPLAYRDAFALAWDKGFGDSRISDLEAEARNLRMAADDAERRCTLARQNLVEEIAARQNAEGEVAHLRRAILEYQQAPFAMESAQDREADQLRTTLARVEAERDGLRADKAECLGAIDAFLAESMPWTHPNGAVYIDQLGEIASRRLQYTIDNEGKAPTTTEGEKP